MKKGFIANFVLILAVFLLLVGYQVPGFAGVTGKIAGTVRDAATGDPLPGVNIILTGTTMGAATDLEGKYFIINVPPGTYSVEASMIGYETLRKTGVLVTTDHTTPVDFSLTQTTITGKEVTVTAEREVVQMDMSASQISSTADEIAKVPLVRDIREYINLQAGIENDMIRGGGLDQTQFMMDGLTVVDNRTNQPVQMVNLSAIKEISIIKGGFNAEYGNVRSGLINIITKDPPQKYSGSIDFRITVPARKHGGPSIFSKDNYWLRPYLDDAVCWTGTNSGAWDEYTQQQYKFFEGWNSVAEKNNSDSNPDNDATPEQLRDLFLWQHRAEGSGALGQKEGKYGNKPDWKADASFGGPVPLIGKYLGNLAFFASYAEDWQMFALPTSRDYFKDSNSMLKFLSRISPSMKLSVEVLYGLTQTVALRLNGDPPGYMKNGSDILWNGEDRIVAGAAMYYPGALNPYKIFRNVYGLSFDHILSPSTFYNIRISQLVVRQRSGDELKERDPKILRYFGNIPVDEQPYGVKTSGGPLLMQDGMYYGAHSAGARDKSNSYAFNLKFDITSQVNKYHQLKAGFTFNYDDIYTYNEKNRWESTWENWVISWRHFPYRMGAYVQDKLEFEGMIANFGVRMDYNQPNSDWFSVEDRYSKYFKAKYKYLLMSEAPKEEAKGHLKLSPRLGISHPISANAKLYFNYGHFYSMPPSYEMYEIRWGKASRSVDRIGNPSAELPKTVAYELGWEYNLRDMFLFHVSGYYKDVSDQMGRIYYTSYDGQVNYSTYENNNYEDIRGFELRIDKRWGRWITGWLNYNYIVNTSGYVGREHYYEDQRMQRIYGLENPYQEVPVARPYARASILITSPSDFGPTMGNVKPLANIRFNTLFHYKSGRYETWDPLETRKLKNNIHWKSTYTFDLRLSKTMRIMGMNMEAFMDINNVFNSNQAWSSRAFASSDDHDRYLESLHLPMYSEQIYKDAGYIAGDDKPGDLRKDKSYINDPNLTYLMNLDPRQIWFGLRMDF